MTRRVLALAFTLLFLSAPAAWGAASWSAPDRQPIPVFVAQPGSEQLVDWPVITQGLVTFDPLFGVRWFQAVLWYDSGTLSLSCSGRARSARFTVRVGSRRARVGCRWDGVRRRVLSGVRAGSTVRVSGLIVGVPR